MISQLILVMQQNRVSLVASKLKITWHNSLYHFNPQSSIRDDNQTIE